MCVETAPAETSLTPHKVTMFLSVRELELRKIPFDVELAPGKIGFEEDELTQVTPILAKGEAQLLSNTLGEIRIQGALQVTMEVPCDRCLEPAKFPVDTKFDLFYRPDAPEDEPGEKHVAAGEIEIGFYEGDGLELEDVLLEQIVLSLPMQKVCKADCKGICPVCGQNRNLAVCSCEVKPVDNRWAAAFESLKK